MRNTTTSTKSVRNFGFLLAAASLTLAGCTMGTGDPTAPPTRTPDPVHEAPAQDELVVTLLGTGTPAAVPERFGYANLVQAGDTTLLFDAGRGAVTRMYQMGVPVGSIDAHFITHFHSDHTNGLVDVFTAGYVSGPTGGRETPMQLYGPEGVVQLAEGIRIAQQWDIETRIVDERVPEAGTRIDAHAVEPGVIFEADGVTVTAFESNHGQAIKPTLGYRVDYNGNSVIFSGDVVDGQGIIEQEGVDLLVHSVGTAPEDKLEVPWIKRVLGHHISPQVAGRTFAEVEPELAVYSHVVRIGGAVPMEDIVESTRETYSGPLEVGKDLMQVRISGEGIDITQVDQ